MWYFPVEILKVAKQQSNNTVEHLKDICNNAHDYDIFYITSVKYRVQLHTNMFIWIEEISILFLDFPQYTLQIWFYYMKCLQEMIW